VDKSLRSHPVVKDNSSNFLLGSSSVSSINVAIEVEGLAYIVTYIVTGRTWTMHYMGHGVLTLLFQ
jgi:hypothetical protein